MCLKFMKKKIRVGILFGGKSFEHEVSIVSAKNILKALDPKKYETVLIGIDKQGNWHHFEDTARLLKMENPKLAHLDALSKPVAVVSECNKPHLVSLAKRQTIHSLDVIFPVLHGPYGEDGTVQGLLKLAHVPFVGASVLGSAIGMDKDVMKRLLRDAGLPIAKFHVLHAHESSLYSFDFFVKEYGLPFFVKPANAGSSVGVSKVKKEADFKKALADAFQFDRKILIETFIPGREIEISILGNDAPIASLPGEVIPKGEFNSYAAKYFENQAEFIIPAPISQDAVKTIQELAVRAYQVLCCEGMARLDFFLKSNGEFVINEINTIPGFTNLSPYPKLWEASGMPYSDLLDRLITLAIERFEQENILKTSISLEDL